MKFLCENFFYLERERERNNTRVAGFTASPYFVGENSANFTFLLVLVFRPCNYEL